MIYTTKYSSPIGALFFCSQNDFLIGLWIENQKYFFATIKEKTIHKDDIKIFNLTKKWLDDYFENKKPSIRNLNLNPTGSKFQKDVWKILTKIHYGQTTTYKKNAEEISKQYKIKSMSYQAVGYAISYNPISTIIPCHKVVGTNGNLTGYASGIDKKFYLL